MWLYWYNGPSLAGLVALYFDQEKREWLEAKAPKEYRQMRYRKAVCVGEDLWIASDKGLFRFTDGELKQVRGVSWTRGGSLTNPEEHPVSQRITDIALGKQGWLWGITEGDNFVLPTDSKRWAIEPALRTQTEPLPTMRYFRLDRFGYGGTPFAISKGCCDEGVWVYAASNLKSGRGLAHLTVDTSAIADKARATYPYLAVIKVTEEHKMPLLDGVQIAVAPDNTVWVAGWNEEGEQIYSVRQGSMKRETGFESLLKSCRVTDIAVGQNGVTYFATDGVGIITNQEGKWKPHPINENLPRSYSGGLRPGEHISVTPKGELCVSAGMYLLTWDEQT